MENRDRKNNLPLKIFALLMVLAFAAIFYFFSAKAAVLVVLAIVVGLVCYFLYPIVQLILATRAMFRAAGGIMSSLRLEVEIEPLKVRPKKARPKLAALVGQFKAMGFVPAGFYQCGPKEGPMVYAEGLAHPAQKIYALVSDGVQPYGEVASYYADGGSYTVSAAQVDDIYERPANMITDRVADLSPAELVARLLQNRPPQGLLETPPEGLLSTMEDDLQALKDMLEILAEEAEDEEEGEGSEGRHQGGDFKFS